MNNTPNILMIVCDDLGYGDLSCMGTQDFETPNIDSLAQNGVRFSNFYAASPVCSPSRASLLTGRYPGNAGVRAILAGHRKASGLQSNIPTISSVMKEQGYQTALCGKWHLGVRDGCRPLDHGFDHFYGFLSGCVDYYSHIFYHGIVNKNMNPCHDLWLDNEEIYENGEYLTHTITREAVSYIKNRDSRRPFFLYVGYNAPHYPMHAPNEYMERYKHLGPERQLMAAMISVMDDGVGKLIQQLKDDNLLNNTIIYFQSDNGPSRESRNWTDGRMDPYYGGSTGGLRGFKYSLFEGGVRVPAILCGPGLIPQGQVYSHPCCAIDILPTLCSITETKLPAEVDGIDILPSVRLGQPIPPRDLCWEMEGQTSVRCGDYKLILNPVEDEERKPECDVFLCNLADDISEQHNLAAENPTLTRDMQARANTFRKGIEERWVNTFADNYKSLA